ncbi:hypothetical protein HDK64DRAFT_319430 [Phyllosticta capitalensis]
MTAKLWTGELGAEEELMRYWCLNIGTSSPRHWIPLIPGTEIDLTKYRKESFQIFCHWTKTLNIPEFDYDPDGQASGPKGMLAFWGFDAYLLGWGLGSPAFCNVIMTRLYNLHKDGVWFPLNQVVERIWSSSGEGEVKLRHPFAKFLVHAYFRAEEKKGKLRPSYPEAFLQAVERCRPTKIWKEKKACDYHIHFDRSLGDSTLGFRTQNVKNWEKYLWSTGEF